jgi:hypothetical protein
LEYIESTEEDRRQTSTSVQERGNTSSVNGNINSPLKAKIFNVGEGVLNLSMDCKSTVKKLGTKGMIKQVTDFGIL